MDEFDLIARYFRPLTRNEPAALALADDAALLTPPEGRDLVLTADALVAGVHFLPNDPPADIAAKLLRVNLSDLAAKGATPRGYLLSAAFPHDIEEAWLREFAEGLASDGEAFGIGLLGGDTVATPGPLTLNIAAIGYVPRGRMLTRVGARPGDRLYVTGTIGDSGLGLKILRGEIAGDAEASAYLTRRYRRPDPRSGLGPKLSALPETERPTSALDVSDGLVADAGHLARASGVRLVVESHKVPLSAAALALLDRRETDLPSLIAAGDDYEILFTAPPEAEAALSDLAEKSMVKVARIGVAEAGEGVVVLDAAGRRLDLPKAGYSHFG